MTQETDRPIPQLRCHDVDPRVADRIRSMARARFGRRGSAIGRGYRRILEPVLVVIAIVASLSWAIGQIRLLTR